ncbi:TPA: hypothetical protein ACSA7L_004450 [Yersinia enterocolitica]|nr:hypothetical protein [Yersinia enterocolitica]
MLSKDEVDRQNFEAWFVPIYHPRHMNRNNAGDYLFIDAEIAWTAWKARSAELRSLREQLAELKALEPIGQIVLSDYDSDGTRTARVACLHDQADWDNFQDGTLLFTESKPAAGLGVEDITEFMRKAFWRGFESARGTENSNIPANWKDSKPNLLLALKAKMSGA